MSLSSCLAMAATAGSEEDRMRTALKHDIKKASERSSSLFLTLAVTGLEHVSPSGFQFLGLF